MCVMLLASVCFGQDPQGGLSANDTAPATGQPTTTDDGQPDQQTNWLDLGADSTTGSSPIDQWLSGESLTGNWLGFGETLVDNGITFKLSLTQIYQQNLNGGTSVHRHAGRWTGSYNAGLTLDLERIANIPGATLYVKAEGSWSDGLDASSIGSVVGNVNDDADGDRSIDLPKLWWEQRLFEERLRIRIGKLSITGDLECRGRPVAFDGNAFANDDTYQFVNSALVNNPTIPSPDDGLGIIVYVEPIDGVYAAAGVADAQANASEMGFNTAFHDEDYFFSIFETGVAPLIPSPNGELPGTYRVGMWYDPQPKQRLDRSTNKRDDVGFYLSFDQTLCRENDQDMQGLGIFGRYGFAHSDYSPIKSFWSLGTQYMGLVPTRDNDVLAFGVARGLLVRDAGFTETHETVIEVYYNMRLSPWLTLTPSIQHVWHPGGDASINDATVVGVRAQLTF